VEIDDEVVQREAAGGFARRLRSHELLFGTVLTVPSVALAELAAEAVDFTWIDLEHGALGVADVQPLSIACRAAGAAPIVRLPSADPGHAGAILDAGVAGVVAPRVESAVAAARLVEQLRRPPRGSRGAAARRANGYGRAGAPGNRPSSAAGQDPDPLCLAQIESPGGVEAAAEIAAVDGVDALVVGCADLSHSLGEEGRLLGSSTVVDAVEQVQRDAAARGLPSGIAGPDDPAVLAQLAAGRSTLLVLSADVRLYARAVDAAVAALRGKRAARTHEPRDAHVRS
jgi:4-hydroxy-2-oxoheptanedioate aldolase